MQNAWKADSDFTTGNTYTRQRLHMYEITQAAGATSGLRYILSVGVAQSFKPCLLDAVECLFIQELAMCKFLYNII